MGTEIISNGELDTSFDGPSSGNGIVTHSISSSDDIAYGIELLNDGKIVIGGVSNNDFLVARFTSNGSLDTDFESDGYNTTDISGSSSTDVASDIGNPGVRT